MLRTILEIPGNQTILAALQSLIAEKKAIAFVGAGASAGMYPLWGQLIHQLSDEAVAAGFATDADRRFWLSIANTKPSQAVSGIRQKLSSPQLGAMLRNIFGPKPGGQRYTPTQAALMRIPFSGYITTNYDPGLIEARSAVRPTATAVGWSTWRDSDEFDRWRDQGQLALPSWCPVLFAHGFYQRIDTVVLGIEEYRRAYAPGAWRRLFEYFWSSTSLVFVGFGFSDPFLDFISGEVVSESGEGALGKGRHIAFVGLGPNEIYSEEGRLHFLRNYGVRPIYYPATAQDHTALLTLLEMLASGEASHLPVIPSLSSTPMLFPARWVHETSNDDKFTGRENEFARLDRWVASPMVRVIGVCAVGGTGKTALVGHWLKNTDGWRSRPFVGLFAWSFYQNRASASFLLEFLKWAHWALGTPRPDKQTNLAQGALSVLRDHNVVVVLDGLEVLQEGPAGSVAVARREPLAAIQRAEEALELAQPRGMRLIHADALILRARARLLEGLPQDSFISRARILLSKAVPLGTSHGRLDARILARVLDDTEDALRIARECGYAWAERDAVALYADAHDALAVADEVRNEPTSAARHREAALRARAEVDRLDFQLRLTAEDLAGAEAKALEWWKNWEKKRDEEKHY